MHLGHLNGASLHIGVIMQIEVNDIGLKAMAANLRAALAEACGPSPAVSHSLSLELLAKTLGYKNWDTLNGVAKKSCLPQKEEPVKGPAPWEVPALVNLKPFTFYIEAHACSESVGYPSWGKVEVTAPWLKSLLQAQAMVREKDLEEVTLTDTLDAWDAQDTLRISGDELIVDKTHFWFQAYPKNASYHVETRMVSIAQLLELIDKGESASDSDFAWADGILFYDGAGVQDFVQALQDDNVIDINQGIIDDLPY